MNKIKELEEKLITAQNWVLETKSQMDYLRKELQNREEMYNQKFNVTPTVGLLSVIY